MSAPSPVAVRGRVGSRGCSLSCTRGRNRRGPGGVGRHRCGILGLRTDRGPVLCLAVFWELAVQGLSRRRRSAVDADRSVCTDGHRLLWRSLSFHPCAVVQVAHRSPDVYV